MIYSRVVISQNFDLAPVATVSALGMLCKKKGGGITEYHTYVSHSTQSVLKRLFAS